MTRWALSVLNSEVQHLADHLQVVQAHRDRPARPQVRHLAAGDLQVRLGQQAAQLTGPPDAALVGEVAEIRHAVSDVRGRSGEGVDGIHLAAGRDERQHEQRAVSPSTTWRVVEA
jgi:hypothetical protein